MAVTQLILKIINNALNVKACNGRNYFLLNNSFLELINHQFSKMLYNFTMQHYT